MSDRDPVRARIEQVGILASFHPASVSDARFAATALLDAGISLVEMWMGAPDAAAAIHELAHGMPNLMVGADAMGSVERARQGVRAGARFLTSSGFDPRLLEFARHEKVLMIPGVLTPTELGAAAAAGAQLVKIFPSAVMGGPRYIRALHAAFPDIAIIAAGGVTLATAEDFLVAGAVALGIGSELVPTEAIESRNQGWIAELARRFAAAVVGARQSAAGPVRPAAS